MVNLYVPLPNLAPGEHAVAVKYTDKNDKTNGPYNLKFSTEQQQMAQSKMVLNMTSGSWLAFRDYQGRVLLYFTHLMTHRAVIKEIRYSLNNENLDQVYKPMFIGAQELPYLYVPKETQFACVQITFTDGTKSKVEKVIRKPGSE